MTIRCKILPACALFTALVFAKNGHTQQTLDPDNFRTVAIVALESGQSEKARQYALALLARDPDDFRAHLIHARALRDLGQFSEAVQSARRATNLAKTNGEKYTSALIMAQTLSSNGNRTRAQLWLRRAAQNAPHPHLAKRVESDFRYVQSRNPWRTDLSFTLSPNSNINNGSARDTSRLNYVISDLLFGAPVDYVLGSASQALSGLEYGIGVTTRYRFKQTERTANDLTLSFSYRSFELSNRAKRAAPTLSGSDFSYGSLQAGYKHKRLSQDGKAERVYSLGLGQSWYGGAEYARFAELGASYRHQLKGGQKLRYSASLDLQSGIRAPDQKSLTLSTDYSAHLPNGGQLILSGNVSASQSPRADIEFYQIQMHAEYALPNPILGANLQVGLGARFRDYAISPHAASGRQDTQVFATADAVLSQIEYFGFNPTVSVKTAVTNSNIGLFDVERLSVGLGIRSSF